MTDRTELSPEDVTRTAQGILQLCCRRCWRNGGSIAGWNGSRMMTDTATFTDADLPISISVPGIKKPDQPAEIEFRKFVGVMDGTGMKVYSDEVYRFYTFDREVVASVGNRIMGEW